MDDIEISNYVGKQTKVDFKINKMSREIYDVLSLCGYVDTHADELFLVNDEEKFDVQNKRVVNVLAPQSGNEAINLSYADNHYLNISELNKYGDNSHLIQNSKIITTDRKICISANGDICEKLTGESDWVIEADPLCCEYEISDLTVYYRTGIPKGWTVKTPDDEKKYPFNDEDRDTQYIHKNFNAVDGSIITIRRDKWYKTDSLVKKSELSSLSNILSDYIPKSTVKNCLSTLSDYNNCNMIDIFQSLSALKNIC